MASPDAARAQTTATDAELAQTTAAPKLPRDYRMLVAAELALEYVRSEAGRALISDPITSQGPIAGSVRFCVHLLSAQPYPVPRRILIFGSRGLFTLGQQEFRKRYLGPLDICGKPYNPFVEVEMKPFPELLKMAQVIRACQAKGEASCVLYKRPGGVTLTARVPAKQ